MRPFVNVRKYEPKHFWHRDRKDAVADAQTPGFLDNAVLWIVIVRFSESLVQPLHSLPARQQIVQWALTAGDRAGFK